MRENLRPKQHNTRSTLLLCIQVPLQEASVQGWVVQSKPHFRYPDYADAQFPRFCYGLELYCNVYLYTFQSVVEVGFRGVD